VDDATIHYLNWDEEAEEHGPASELFHELHGIDNTEIPDLDATEFNDLYREVREIEDPAQDPEQIWDEWNRGSGQESEEFLEMRYCEPCDTYQIGADLAIQHAVENHGYDAFEDSSEPEYIHGIRSMSIGDVIQFEDRYLQAQAFGFEDLDLDGDDL